MRELKLVVILSLVCSKLGAFTLNLTGKGFDKNEVRIHVAQTDCSNAGFSTERFRDLIEDAVEDYWNSVPSADLKLKVQPVGSIDVSGQTHQEILDSGMIPAHSILAGCSADAFDSPNALGSAQNACEGDVCRSVFLVNSRADSQVSSVQKSQQIAIMAHEIGHSIGLGHSEYAHNLMYYKIGGKKQEWLGDDDIEGVSYLYPHDPVGCDFLPFLGAMGSIKEIGSGSGNEPPTGGKPLTILAGFLLGFYLLRCLSSLPSK